MNKVLALFDFDGTITHKDSMIEMIRYVHGDLKFISGLFICAPTILMFQLGLLDRQKAKERMLTYFFGGLSVEKFNEYCRSFSNEVLPRLVRSEAAKKIQWHRDNNHKLVLVSASPENWLFFWCYENCFICISTKLEVKDGYLTGKINGKNCYGSEKVGRVKEVLDLSEFSDIFAYGDTKGDNEILSLAKHRFYRSF